jgi:hypothetical protein
VPAELVQADLWTVLRPVVRRHGERNDGRLLIDDSKRVYAAGLPVLELGVRAALDRGGETLADCLDALAPACHPALRREAWYVGATALPVEAASESCAVLAARFREGQALAWLPARAVVVCPERFNAILDRFDSKAAVLGFGLGELVQAILASVGAESRRAKPGGSPDEPLLFHIDKHGGRNFYGPMIQAMLSAGTVMAIRESNEQSVYRILGLAQPVELTFQPRADTAHPCVALASMVSKYLRELLMREFNAFWQQQVPGLKPTAGYPADAGRFYDAIRPAAAKLGIAERQLWRRK